MFRTSIILHSLLLISDYFIKVVNKSLISQIPIDSCVMGVQHSAFLQQVSLYSPLSSSSNLSFFII